MSWAFAAAMVLIWETGISFCFGIHSPFATLTGIDYTQGITIFGILIMLTWCFSLIGSFVCYLLDTAEVLPFYALLPRSMREVWPGRRKSDDPELVGPNVTGLNRWGMSDLPRPYVHTVVTIVLFAVTVAAPHLIYAFMMDDVGNDNNIALGLVIGLPIVGYIVTFIFWFFFPDPYVWGPHSRNVAALRSKYEFTTNRVRVQFDTRMAQFRIYKTILTLAFIHVASIIVLSFVRFTHTEVDWSWITAAVVGGIVLIVALLITLVLYAFRNKESDHVYVQTMTGGEDKARDDIKNDDDMDKNDDEATVVDDDDDTKMNKSFNYSLASRNNLSKNLRSQGILG